MGTTQRVLSGSRTRGSTASPSGSIIYSYQGIYANTDAAYFGSLLPRIGSGARTKLYKGSSPLSENEFDDSLVINNDTADMRGVSGSVISTRIGFDLERMTFGQAPTTQRGEPFADISGFDPVSYLQDPGHTMWPANLWNAGILPDHEFDGVIEVFDIRREILGYIDLKHEGRGPRGAVVGSFSETSFGSTEITDTWYQSAPPLTPFFDGPSQMAAFHARDIPVASRMSFTAVSASWTDPYSAQPLQGYQGLVREDISPYISTDVHEIIYSKIYAQQPNTPSPLVQYDLNARWQSIPGQYYTSGDDLIGWWRFTLDDIAKSATGAYRDKSAWPGSPPIGTGGYGGVFASWYEIPNSSVLSSSLARSTFLGMNAMEPNTNAPSAFIQKGSALFDGSCQLDIFGLTSGSLNDLIGGNFTAGTAKSFTYACWVQIGNAGANVNNPSAGEMGTLFNVFGGPSGDFVPFINFWIEASGGNDYIKAIRKGSVGSDTDNLYTSIAGTISKNTFHHFVAVFDATKCDGSNDPWSIYYDGTLVAGAQSNLTPCIEIPNVPNTEVGGIETSFAQRATIGGYFNDTGANWDGVLGANSKPCYLADAALWDKALSATEVKNIYSAKIYGALRDGRVERPGSTVNALKLLNSSSCGALTNPEQKTATHGFYFDKKAGSIVYGDW